MVTEDILSIFLCSKQCSHLRHLCCLSSWDNFW